MVRLVFRPYTQIWRSICTSESLRASTRVSPGFTLFRHSSPSFGSQHVCSHSDLSPEGLWPADIEYHCYFHYAWEFVTPILAHMLDSLVRVSRRGKENHFASITSTKWLASIQPKTKLKGISPEEPTSLKAICPKPNPCWPITYHSALTASSERKIVGKALVSFASLSAISGTL